jgi:hypothetical protein
MTLVAAVSRLTEAPMTPRCAETAVIALVIAVSALIEESALVKLSVTPAAELSPNVVAERALMDVPISTFAAVATVLPSLMNTLLLFVAPA